MGLILNLGVHQLKSFVKLILYGLVVQIVLYFVGNFWRSLIGVEYTVIL